MGRIDLILSLILAAVPFSVSKSCVPLDDCPSVVGLILQIQSHTIPPYTTRPELIRRVASLKCDSDPTNWEDPFVWCQSQDQTEDYYITRGALNTLGRDVDECHGRLKISALSPSQGMINLDVESPRVNILDRWGGKAFDPSDVTGVEVEGNCCWSLFPKTWQRGETQILIPGYIGAPHFVPKSMKTVNCPDA